MMNKIAIGLLAFGLALLLPSLRASLQEISIGGLWLEFGFWSLGLAVLLFASAKDHASSNTNKVGADPTSYLSLVLVPAIVALLWGIYSGSAVWNLLGWCMGLCTLMGMFLKLSPKRLVHLGLISFLLPFSLWPLATEFQLVAQRISTFLAGSILDLTKIFFFTRGNVIGLVSTDFLQTQQCAGLRLLGTVLLVVFVYGFARKYSWFRATYLLLVGAFWVLVLSALRIAYLTWLQDGQSARLEESESMFDAICLIGILFLTWSADQFFAAFSDRGTDSDKEETPQQQNPARGDLPAEPYDYGPKTSVSTLICLAVMIALGAWQFYRSLADPLPRLNTQELASAIDQLKFDAAIDGWELEESSRNHDALTPVSRQSSQWPERQWELKSSSAQPTSMRLRIDGIWIHPPRSDWLWRWFGWQTESPTRDQQGNAVWGMSRSVVEEGYVVSRHIGASGAAIRGQPLIQVSLVQEGYSSIPEAQRNQQRALFDKLLEVLQGQLQERFSGVVRGKQGT